MRTIPLVMRDPGNEGGGAGDDKGKSEADGLKAAVAAERKGRQDAESRLAKIEADSKAAAEAAAAEKGEHKKLYDDLAPKHKEATDRLKALEARETARVEKVATRNAERIKALPETTRKLASGLADKLDADALADWLEDAAPVLGDTTRPAGTVKGKGGGGEDPIPPAAKTEWATYGQRLGISERDYFENTWKPRQKPATA